MKNRLETIPFKDTPEKRAQLEQIIADHKDIPGALVQVLKRCRKCTAISRWKFRSLLLKV